MTHAVILFRVWTALRFVPPDLLERPADVVEEFLQLVAEWGRLTAPPPG